MNREFRSIVDLLRHHRPQGDDPIQIQVGSMDARQLAELRQARHLSREQLVDIYVWKEPRKRQLAAIYRNSADDVVRLTGGAFSASEEYKRISLLDHLQGVGIPVASAILAVHDPQWYGVIDTRVWRLLYQYGEVDYDSEGTYLTLESWLDYLPKLRHWANELGLTVREVERTLFEYRPAVEPAVSYGIVDTTERPTWELKETVMIPAYPNLDQVLDAIGQLPSSQREMLLDIVRGRHSDEERRQIAQEARTAITQFRVGDLEARPIDEIIANLDASLLEPDDE